ncbi:MAG: hypothetical protein IKE01_05215 [Clostridia bacterium]|nr:hypothetical protein [Clostridia bacterium]
MSNSKKIKIVSGDGKKLKISEVEDHIKLDKKNKDVDKNKIIIPTEKKPKKKID